MKTSRLCSAAHSTQSSSPVRRARRFPVASLAARVRALASGVFLLGLAAKSLAGITLLVNGGSIASVKAGEPITLTWSATPDVTYLQRGWGENLGTSLPGPSGSETVRAQSPSVTTGYAYSVTGYSNGQQVQASVQVNVQPWVVNPPYTPIVWVPSVPNFQLQTLSFYVVPDAQIGVPYSATINATGKAPLTFSAVNLPDGLSIVGNTITGTPTEAALLQGGNFTLLATDADGITSATLACMRTPILSVRPVVPVAAPVVFDSGAADVNGVYTNDLGTNNQLAASGFMLPKATKVTSVRVIGCYLSGTAPSRDNFTVKFLARGPSPFSTWPTFPAAGEPIATFTPISVNRVKTGRTTMGMLDAEYAWDINFSGVDLQANTLYYVCVINNTSRTWSWSSATYQGYPGWGAFSMDGGATFPGGSAELAFRLSDAPPVVTTPSPTPAPVGTTYKLDLRRNGKGTVTFTPTGSSSSGTVFAAGTIVTVTAAPDPADASSVWKGWTGDVVSSSPTIKVTMSKALTLQANFR